MNVVRKIIKDLGLDLEKLQSEGKLKSVESDLIQNINREPLFFGYVSRLSSEHITISEIVITKKKITTKTIVIKI